MARKRIADKEPAISNEGAAAAPAKAPISKAPSETVRAPRSSANSANHRHKKELSGWEEQEPTLAETAITSSGLASLAASVAEPAKELSRSAEQPSAKAGQLPTREEIAVRAYLIAESRGFQGGSTEDDWLNAERQLLAERA